MSDTAPPPAIHVATRQSWLTTFSWAAYLACSWTWCIGMFLPVLLARDFGIWGFVVFAVPNVVGAAGMGWVLRSGSSARAIAERHQVAVRAFSRVTICFQLYFLAWMFSANLRTMNVSALPWLLVGGVVIGSFFVPRRFDRARTLTGLTLAFSMAMMAVLGVRGDLALPTGGTRSVEVLALAPVCVLGFLLCPYLDGTFLEARIRQPARAGTVSFGFGFGVLFFLMIVFTLLYAHMFDGEQVPPRFVRPGSIAAMLVAAHIWVQLLVTCEVHRGRGPARRTARPALMAYLGLAALACVGAALGHFEEWRYAGLSIGEVVYRGFMSMYGLVFPAYVWLCMIPTRGEAGTTSPSRAKLSVMAVAVVAAMPFYWIGFIERQTWWLGPGLLIVLAARAALPRGPVRRSV